MGRVAQRAIVANAAIRRRVLHQRAEDVRAELESVGRPDAHLDSQGLGARPDDPDGLRVAVLGHQEDVSAPAPALPVQHRHGLGGRSRLVEERGVRDLQARQVDHGGLEVEQRFQPTLRDFGLVGRVLRVPAGVFQDVALDHAGGDGAGIPHAEIAPPHFVLRRDFAQACQQLRLGNAFGDPQGALEADVRRHRLGDQGVQAVAADEFQHFADIVRPRPQMPGREVGRMAYRGSHRIPSHSPMWAA